MRWPDLLGLAVRTAPDHRLLHRVRGHWERGLASDDVRRRHLRGVGVMDLRMWYPYERHIWIRPEQFEDVCYTQSLLAAGDVFVDCGANVGLWTLAAAAAVGRSGHVVAIEPGPSVFARLAHHVQLNKLDARATLVCCALGELPMTANFDLGGALHNVAHLVAGEAPGSSRATTFVDVRPLDAILPDHRVHGVKIDVEGHELSVLRGAQALLRRGRPWVIVEYNADELESNRLGDWPVHRWLVSEGWKAHRLSADELPLDGSWQRPRGLGHMNLLYRFDHSG